MENVELKRQIKNEKQREYRNNNNNSCTRRYEKTERGFLMRMYRNMQSRTTGVQKQKAHLYKNKFLLDRETFYNWAVSRNEFYKMFNTWKGSGYNRKLTPTVDRINSKLGYRLENMEWVTHSENSRRGANNRWRKNNIL